MAAQTCSGAHILHSPIKHIQIKDLGHPASANRRSVRLGVSQARPSLEVLPAATCCMLPTVYVCTLDGVLRAAAGECKGFQKHDSSRYRE